MSKTVQSPELEGMYRIHMVEFYATRVITYFLNDEEAQSFSAWPFCLASSASMQIMLKEQYLRSTDHNHTPEKILHIFFTSKRMVTLSGIFIHMERINIYTHTHTHIFLRFPSSIPTSNIMSLWQIKHQWHMFLSLWYSFSYLLLMPSYTHISRSPQFLYHKIWQHTKELNFELKFHSILILNIWC